MFSLGMDLGTGIVKAALDVVPLIFLVHLFGMKRVVAPIEQTGMLEPQMGGTKMELAQ